MTPLTTADIEIIISTQKGVSLQGKKVKEYKFRPGNFLGQVELSGV